MTAATAALPRQVPPRDASRSRPPPSAAARAHRACAAAPGTTSSPARGAPRRPLPGPARVHRRLSESRAVPTAQGTLAGGLRHHDQASVLRTVTYLRKWSLCYATKTSRKVIIYSRCRKSGVNSVGDEGHLASTPISPTFKTLRPAANHQALSRRHSSQSFSCSNWGRREPKAKGTGLICTAPQVVYRE